MAVNVLRKSVPENCASLNALKCVINNKLREIYPHILVNETYRPIELRFYWYYESTCFGQPCCPSSGVLSRTSTLVHFMQIWWPFATRSRTELPFHPAPGSKWSSYLHKMYQWRCKAKNSWWWAERLPETCRFVIPIKLEFSVSVGFIHKEFFTMHGHMILKLRRRDPSKKVKTAFGWQLSLLSVEHKISTVKPVNLLPSGQGNSTQS